MSKRPGPRQPRVTIFTTPVCVWCKAAKAHCLDNDIEFTEVDIFEDHAEHRRMALMTGQHGVPVILVGEKAIIGWDPEEFDRLMGRG